jgi:hypothetical protein
MFINISIHHLVLITAFVFVSVAFSNASSDQTLQVLQEIEDNLKSASNSDNYFVLEKKVWAVFKDNIKADHGKFMDVQDSLSRIIRQQSDSLMKMKNFPPVQSKPVNKDLISTGLPWLLCLFFGVLIMLGLGKFVRMNAKMNDALEQYKNIEGSYDKSKRFWIDRERQLKRELIDANTKLEEVIKNKS